MAPLAASTQQYVALDVAITHTGRSGQFGVQSQKAVNEGSASLASGKSSARHCRTTAHSSDAQILPEWQNASVSAHSPKKPGYTTEN